MNRRGVYLGLVAGLLLQGAVASRGEAPETPAAPQIPLIVFDHMLFVDVRVNGEGPFRMLLDTGASPKVLLSKRVADALDIQTRTVRHRMQTADNSGLTFIDVTTLERVQIGQAIDVEQVPAMVHDLSEARDAVGKALDGVIGLGLFADLPLTIDVNAERLVIEDQALGEPDHRRIFSFLWHQQIPVVQIRIDAMSVQAVLDTGDADALSIPRAWAGRFAFQGDWQPGNAAAGLGGAVRPRVNRLDGELRIGPLAMHEPLVRADARGYPVIGMEALEHMRWTIDQTNQRIRFEPYDTEPIITPPLRIAGMGCLRPQGGWIVHSIIPGSPASKLDIRINDRVSHIDGKPTDEYDRQTYKQLLDAQDKITLRLHRGDKTWDVDVPVVVWVK